LKGIRITPRSIPLRGALPEMCILPHMPGFPSVPFQRRHAHQTYTVPQSVMKLHLAGQRQAQHAAMSRAAPGYCPVHVSCERRITPAGRKTPRKTEKPRIAGQRPGVWFCAPWSAQL